MASEIKSNKSKLIVSNSYTEASGFSEEAEKLMEATLTYDDQEAIYELKQIKIQLALAFRYRKFKSINYLKSRIAELELGLKVCWFKASRFPTGHLELVVRALDVAGYPFEIVDSRVLKAEKVIYTWASKPKEPRYYQSESLALAVNNDRGVFELSVGSGKTYIAQMIIHALQVPTLVIVPSKDLCVQTVDDYSLAFGKTHVEYVSTAAKAKTAKPIKICSIHMLSSLERKGELSTFLEGLGMIIIDETHHAGARSYVDLLPYFDHIYYRFGFSGTFMRNDSRTLDMWGFLSTVLYRYGAAQATKEGFLTPFEVLVHDIEGKRGLNYQTEYTANYCQNGALLESIGEIIRKAGTAQVLILVGRKDLSGKVIAEYLKELNIDNKYVDGDSDRDHVKQVLNNFNNKKIQILIGSSVIGEGIDIRSSEHLIMAQGGKSEIAITQAAGRLVRLFKGKTKGFLHDFRFSNTKYLEKHLKQRLEIYKKNFDGIITDVYS